MARTKKSPEKKYFCTRCGKGCTTQIKNFPKTRSPMWAANDGYLPVCVGCVDDLYEKYLQKFGTISETVYRMCMKFDLYYSDNTMNAVIAASGKFKNAFSAYLSKSNLVQVEFDSFDDTLDQQAQTLILSKGDLDEAEINGIKVKKVSYDRWGDGFEPAEYNDLDAHYRLLTGSVQDWGSAWPVIRSLCILDVLQKRALKEKDTKEFATLSKAYRDTYKEAGFKITQNTTDMEDQPLGVMAMVVEKICPAEYYKDKTLFSDFDKIGEYFERFIVRPFRNLLTGSTDLDQEYSITGDGDSA